MKNFYVFCTVFSILDLGGGVIGDLRLHGNRNV